MLTRRGSAVVSLILAAFSLGACARASSPEAWGVAALDQPATLRFDNESEVSVDVYLISETREWRLGRVAPGARAMLRVPQAAVRGNGGMVRLAALAGAPMLAQASGDPRAILTIPSPVPNLLLQEWRFSQRQNVSPQLLGLRADGYYRP